MEIVAEFGYRDITYSLVTERQEQGIMQDQTALAILNKWGDAEYILGLYADFSEVNVNLENDGFDGGERYIRIEVETGSKNDTYIIEHDGHIYSLYREWDLCHKTKLHRLGHRHYDDRIWIRTPAATDKAAA